MAISPRGCESDQQPISDRTGWEDYNSQITAERSVNIGSPNFLWLEWEG